MSFSWKASASLGTKKNSRRYSLAGFSFTITILDAGAAPIKSCSGTSLPAATLAINQGIETVITNGKHPERIYDIVEGKEVGTRFIGKL